MYSKDKDSLILPDFGHVPSAQLKEPGRPFPFLRSSHAPKPPTSEASNPQGGYMVVEAFTDI